MKCQNCGKTLKKMSKPEYYTEDIGGYRVKWRRDWECPTSGCDIKVGVAVETEELK